MRRARAEAECSRPETRRFARRVGEHTWASPRWPPCCVRSAPRRRCSRRSPRRDEARPHEMETVQAGPGRPSQTVALEGFRRRSFTAMGDGMLAARRYCFGLPLARVTNRMSSARWHECCTLLLGRGLAASQPIHISGKALGPSSWRCPNGLQSGLRHGSDLFYRRPHTVLSASSSGPGTPCERPAASCCFAPRLTGRSLQHGIDDHRAEAMRRPRSRRDSSAADFVVEGDLERRHYAAHRMLRRCHRALPPGTGASWPLRQARRCGRVYGWH